MSKPSRVSKQAISRGIPKQLFFANDLDKEVARPVLDRVRAVDFDC